MKFILIALLAVAIFASNTNAQCDCSDFACGCCLENIPLLNSICVNVTWAPGISEAKVALEINGVPVYTDVVEGPGPFGACVTEVCVVCLTLNDLDISTQGACGEIGLNATCLGLVQSWDLGAFQMGQCAEAVEAFIPLNDQKKVKMLI